MSIHKEFERLRTLFTTAEGVQQIEDAWQMAMNYEKKGEEWYKKSSSSGDKVAGFAIDEKSDLYVMGAIGRDHHQPRFDLHGLIGEKSKVKMSFDEIQARILEGRAAYIEVWRFPLIQINGMLRPEEVVAVEKRLIDLGIGLPVRGLFSKQRTQK